MFDSSLIPICFTATITFFWTLSKCIYHYSFDYLDFFKYLRAAGLAVLWLL